MQHKNIRRILKQQLKRDHPHWKKLPKKDKKAIVKNLLTEAVKEYDFSQIVDAPLEELIGIEGQQPTAGIMNFRFPDPPLFPNGTFLSQNHTSV